MNMDAWVVLGLAGISFFVGWGVMSANQKEIDRRIEQLELDLSKQLELVHGLRDVYVTYQHFNEIMNTIRESQRELKENMQRVLDLLTAR